MTTAGTITTLRDLASNYVLEHSLTDGSEVTFLYAIVSFEKFLGRSALLSDCSRETINVWLSGLESSHASSTRTYYRRRVITLWYWANKLGLVSVGPGRVRKPRAAKGTRTPPARGKLGSQTPRQWPFRGPSYHELAASCGSIFAPAKAGPETLLLDYFNSYYAPMKLSGRSSNTKRLYRSTLSTFGKFLGRKPQLLDLNDETVSRLMAWTLEHGRSPRSGNKYRDQLLAIWRYAARKRHVELFPDVEPLQDYKRAPTAWTVEQLGRLLHAARSFELKLLRKDSLCGIRFGDWWGALLLTLYDTGLRIGAVMQLRRDDFDRTSQRLFVRAEIQKQRADQVLPVSDETTAALARCVEGEPRENLFPWPYSLSMLYKHFNLLLKAAKLPTGRRDKFHKIRRTSATQAELALGPGAATLHLGHSSARVTEKYLDRSMLPSANVAASLPRPMMPVPKGGDGA